MGINDNVSRISKEYKTQNLNNTSEIKSKNINDTIS